MKQESVCDDKECQSTKYAKSACHDKNCQSTQCIHMWPLKPAIKSNHVQSVRPTPLQSTYQKCSQIRPVPLCDDKNCQYTKKHSYEECHVRPVCDDKNHQLAKCAHMQKPAMPQSTHKKLTQSTHLQSLSKTARKQIGTQPEITRNIKHSTSKCCFPSGSTNMCPDSRNLMIQSKHMRPLQAEIQEEVTS